MTLTQFPLLVVYSLSRTVSNAQQASFAPLEAPLLSSALPLATVRQEAQLLSPVLLAPHPLKAPLCAPLLAPLGL